MTPLQHLRIRARRARQGSILEWHPADEDDARDLLEKHALVIKTIYDLVDRRQVSDGDVVAVIEIWPASGSIEDIEVPDEIRRDRSQWVLDDVRASVQDYAGGLA